MWLRGAALLVMIGAVLAGIALFGATTLPDRPGPPVESLVIERTMLKPGTIELTVRGAGADAVSVAQIAVNDTFTDFRGADEPVARLASATLVIDFPWVDGQPYLITLLTGTGAVIEHQIPVAVATPEVGAGSLGTMILLGLYVGVVPVGIGMLVLPLLRRAGPMVTRLLLAFTVGLLGFIGVDAALDGIELAERTGGPFGGTVLVLLAAAATFVALSGVDRWIRARRPPENQDGRRAALRLAALVAGSIGLHNLGEGLAIGSAFAVGELAIGTALVVGFALHNTTEGLAIVAPLAETASDGCGCSGLGCSRERRRSWEPSSAWPWTTPLSRPRCWESVSGRSSWWSCRSLSPCAPAGLADSSIRRWPWALSSVLRSCISPGFSSSGKTASLGCTKCASDGRPGHLTRISWCGGGAGPPRAPGVAWSVAVPVIAVSVVVAPHGPPVSGVAMSAW
jgi:zinc transporter ZupT